MNLAPMCFASKEAAGGRGPNAHPTPPVAGTHCRQLNREGGAHVSTLVMMGLVPSIL